MTKDENGFGLTGEEMVALAGSVAICLAKNLTPREVCLMRTFFATVASNLSTIENTESICRLRV